MRVTVREQETLDTVIARDADTAFDDLIPTDVVSETYSDPRSLKDFGFSKAVQGRARTVAEAAGDEDPEFVVVRTEEGWSRGGRLYDGDVLESIAEQVNAKQPVAHLGHIKDEDVATAFPEPQTRWLGALVKTEASKLKERTGELVKVIYTAGYNLPGAKVRTYLKTGVVDSTSWQGTAQQVPIPGRGVRVVGFDLHSLDWARKLSEGMATAKVVALAREMKEGSTKMDKDLAQVTPEEFKEANPNGHALLVREAVAEKDVTIAEMQTTIDAGEEDKKLLADIRAALKLAEGANPLEKIAALVKKLGEKAKASVDDALDALLAEKVPDEETRKLVRRLLPVAEMHAAAEDCADAEAVEAKVKEMTEHAFNTDEMIQERVSEQVTPPAVRRQEQIRDGGSKVDYDKLGMRRERVTMGG